MKRKTLLTLLLGATVAVCFAAAFNINGKWIGNLDLGSGEVPISYTFNTDGTKLTGNVTYANNTFQITDGKVKGDSILFNVDYSGQPIANSGKCYADSIGIDVDVNSQIYHLKLVRADK
jgi:hypothetical protein